MLGPIFAREFLTVPRTAKHYRARAAAFGGLLTLGITAWLATTGLGSGLTLGETARFGQFLFQIFALVALVLVVFFAAVSAAATVAREKDRRTFILLLLSDLRDYEIVLGKMIGSLLPIMLLLIGLLPVLALMLLLGGLHPNQTLVVWLILLGSAFAAGSLGALVALWRDRTYQSLAFSVLGLVFYFCLVRVGIAAAQWYAPERDWSRVQAMIDPVAAIFSVAFPRSGEAAQIAPAFGFVGVAAGVGILLNAIGIWRLRVWNPGREAIMQREGADEEEANAASRISAHAAPGKTRDVWANPILWREVRTHAYGRKPYLIKLLYLIVLGLICYGAMTAFRERVPFQAAYGLLPVAFLSFFLIAAQSVTAITSERDSGALDLLLVTDLSPKEFVFGKLLGIAYNVKEYLLPPLVLACVYAGMGLLASPPARLSHLAGQLNTESLIAVLGGLLLLLAFVLIFGVFIALRVADSRQAIPQALGTVFFLTVGTLVCIYLIMINGGTFEYQFASFSLFLIAGIGGLLWVFNGELPSTALTLAATCLPPLVFYVVTYVLVAKPGSPESAPPFLAFVVMGFAFGFPILAMLIPLLSEFDVALGRTRAED